MINNKKLLEQIIISRKENQVTDALFHMICETVDRLLNNKKLKRLTYVAPMQAYTIDKIISTSILKFNPEKSDNPYAYMVTCINSYFIGYIHKERAKLRFTEKA
jgi:hypothetical protein